MLPGVRRRNTPRSLLPTSRTNVVATRRRHRKSTRSISIGRGISIGVVLLIIAAAATFSWLVFNNRSPTAREDPLKRHRLDGVASASKNESAAELPPPPPQSDEERRRKWDSLKSAMCPDMSPNPKVWPTLFELARAELGFSEERIPPNPADSMFFRHFFAWVAGGVGWMSASGDDSLVYLRVWKAANEQILRNLNATLSQRGNFWLGDTREMWAPIPRAKRLRTCVVTAVRDPVSHFLSGYNEMEYRVAAGQEGHEWTAPGKTQVVFFRYANGTEARFEQFVADFVGGAKSSGIYPSTPPWNIYHVFSMTGVLWELKQQRDELGLDFPRLTAYLTKLDDLNDEFPKLLMGDCHGLPPQAGRPWVRTSDHKSSLDEFGFYDAAKRVWIKQGATARALCALHALDYACFDRIPVRS